MPLVLTGYLVLSYLGADGLAQFVYLLPMMLATAFAVSAAWAASPRTRARAVWILLSVSIAISFMVESYYSWPRRGGDAPSALGVPFNVGNALALVMLVMALVFLGAIDRLGWRRVLRLAFDAGALMVLGFVIVFRVLSALIVPDVGLVEAAGMTVYSLTGVLIIVLTGYVSLSMPSERRRPWTKSLGWGTAVFGVALVLWPFWILASSGPQPSRLMVGVVTALTITAYYLVFVAALYRLVTPEEPWGQAFSEPLARPAAWQGVTVSILVLLSVVVLGFAAYDSYPAQSAQGQRFVPYTVVYFSTLIVATVCLVGRTALATLESDELRTRSLIDPITGASNPRSFDEHMAERVLATRRFGEPFALILLDLDDFARVNEVMSLSAGDRVLADVAVAIGRVIGTGERVFRLSSDEFAALVLVSTRTDAEQVAYAIAQAIRGIPVPGGPLTASIGYAFCPDDALQQDALLDRADGALAWATHHGRGLVIGYDQQVEQALGAGGRLRMLEEDTKLGVARALMAAADARDPRSHFHSRSVAALACLLAAELGFDPEHVERVRVASMLHDVGKLALSSPQGGRQSYEKRVATQREHCELGERMLASLAMPDVPRWVRSHHERWDGQGYPDGLKATKIPLESRIIALADAYDTMTGEDRLGGPLSKAAALQEIDQGMGSRFDPSVAERFIHVVASMNALGWTDDWSAA